MTGTIHDITDHGMWRGKHRWTIVMEDEHGKAAVSAVGENVTEAILHASATFDNRRIPTDEERAAMRRNSEALKNL